MHRRSGFTLIEVLLTLALLGLVSMVLISGVSNFFNLRDERPDDRFWKAVTSARQTALEQEQTVALSYDKKTKALQWTAPGIEESLALSVSSFRFLPEDKNKMFLIGGVLTETDAMTHVRFYPDGTCDAFRVEIIEEDNRKEVIRIDPWTCAPILKPAP